MRIFWIRYNKYLCRRDGRPGIFSSVLNHGHWFEYYEVKIWNIISRILVPINHILNGVNRMSSPYNLHCHYLQFPEITVPWNHRAWACISFHIYVTDKRQKLIFSLNTIINVPWRSCVYWCRWIFNNTVNVCIMIAHNSEQSSYRYNGTVLYNIPITFAVIDFFTQFFHWFHVSVNFHNCTLSWNYRLLNECLSI